MKAETCFCRSLTLGESSKSIYVLTVDRRYAAIAGPTFTHNPARRQIEALAPIPATPAKTGTMSHCHGFVRAPYLLDGRSGSKKRVLKEMAHGTRAAASGR